MKIDDLLTLVNAGFTKNDIISIAKGQAVNKPEEQEKEKEIEKLKETINNIQKNNIQTAQIDTKEETSDDVWKNFFSDK